MQVEAESLAQLQPQTQFELTDGSATVRWRFATKAAFRFAFAYLVIYNVDVVTNIVPLASILLQKYASLWNVVVPWVGKHVLHLSYPITVLPNGSGDTTYNYVQVFCYLVLAAAATLIWSVLDRKRANYEKLHQWLRIYIRFALASTMIGYGAFKVIKSQFPDPSLDRLLQPYGDSSPMGLLWTFMGYSKLYNVFAGGVEMLGGILLIWRRTTTLGALVSIGAIANVFMLNMSYDVPVKLLSFNLMLMAGFLVLPDLRRLADFFVLNRPAPPAPANPLFKRRWLKLTAAVVWGVLFAAVICESMYISYQSSRFFTDAAHKSPLYGIWSVDEFSVDGQAHPALVTDQTRWNRLVFDYPTFVAVQLMNGSRQRYLLTWNAEKKTLALSKRADQNWKSDLSYEKPDADTMTVQGKFDGHDITARLHRTDAAQFLLVNRGFHWINETPYNQ